MPIRKGEFNKDRFDDNAGVMEPFIVVFGSEKDST